MKFPPLIFSAAPVASAARPISVVPGEMRRLIDAAQRLGPMVQSVGHYATIFGLIAATGMRVSEAIAIGLPDVTNDRLIMPRPSSRRAGCNRSTRRLDAPWTDISRPA
ncbi:hypothetical protein [Rhizobium gallicum]|nr:hypothetical protein [Rhizobium gallicum]